jgi:hypothetical protein
LQLCASKIAETEVFHKVLALLNDIGVFMNDSPKRQEALRKMQELCDIVQLKLTKVSAVCFIKI